MTLASSNSPNTPARGRGSSGGGSNSMLLELIDRILDKGIVIDAWARVSVLSIELLTVEARVVVASVDTYLRYAEAIGNTALASQPRPQQAQQPQAAQQVQPQQQTPALPQPQQQNGMPQWQAQPQQAQQAQQYGMAQPQQQRQAPYQQPQQQLQQQPQQQTRQ